METSLLLPMFIDVSEGAKSFYIYNKYSFFNTYKLNSSYVYLHRILWADFFANYDFFLDTYAETFKTNIYFDLKTHLFHQLTPSLAFFNETDSELPSNSFEELLVNRAFSGLLELFTTSTLSFNMLLSFLKFDHLNFFNTK